MMQAKIAGFDRQVSGKWDGRRHPVVFAAELLTANAPDKRHRPLVSEQVKRRNG